MPHNDLVAFTFWATPELSEAVKRLSRRTGRTVQALMTEAMEDLVRKYGEKSPART
jgi:hypothetical protein